MSSCLWFFIEAAESDVSKRGAASTDTRLDDVAVDEDLFLEEVDDEEEEEVGVAAAKGGVTSLPAEVDVDESLFDIDDLQELDLNDPAILEAPGDS